MPRPSRWVDRSLEQSPELASAHADFLGAVFLEALNAFQQAPPEQGLMAAQMVLLTSLPKDEPRVVNARHVARALRLTGHHNLILLTREVLHLRQQQARQSRRPRPTPGPQPPV